MNQDTKVQDQHWYQKQNEVLCRRLRRRTKKMNAIKELHRNRLGTCRECSKSYPCETVQIIDMWTE